MQIQLFDVAAIFLMAVGSPQEVSGAIELPTKSPSATAEDWLRQARELDRAGKEGPAIEAYRKAVPLPAAHEALGRYLKIDSPSDAAAHFQAAAAAFDQTGDATAANRCRCEAIRLSGEQASFQRLLQQPTGDRNTAKLLPELANKCGHDPSYVADLKRWMLQFPDEVGPVAALAECLQGESPLVRWLDSRIDADGYAALARLRRGDPVRLVSMVRELDGLAAKQPLRAEAIMSGLQREPAAIVELLKHYSAPRHNRWQGECQRVIRLALAGDCLDIAESTLKSWLPGNRHHSVHVNLYDALLQLHEMTGQFHRADELCRSCLRDFPDEDALLFHYRRARALMHLDQEREALAAAAEVVARANGSNLIGAHLLQIEVLAWFGRHDVVHTHSRKLLEENADAVTERRIRMRLAALAENRSDHAAAEGHLLRVLELSPKDPEAHNNLGYYWADQNRRLEDAERLCLFAVGHGRPGRGLDDPVGDDAAYRDSLGWVYYRQGRLMAAQEQLERALALPGGKLDSVVWEHYGDVLAARGKADRARQAWTHAVARMEAKRHAQSDPRPARLKNKLNEVP